MDEHCSEPGLPARGDFVIKLSKSSYGIQLLLTLMPLFLFATLGT